MSTSVQYKLQYPFDIKSAEGKILESYTSFDLKRPKAKHLKATDRVAGEAAKTIALIAACAGVLPEFLDDLDIVREHLAIRLEHEGHFLARLNVADASQVAALRDDFIFLRGEF